MANYRLPPPKPPVAICRTLVGVAAALYLLCIWLDAVGTGWPAHFLPGPLRLFVQVAQLFPRAAPEVTEFRARGWRCATQKFEELDLAPYFPIHPDDKEGRFDRALFFYLKERRVHEALDAYISAAETRRGSATGGVMLLSLRWPIPEVGAAEARYRRIPLDEVPRAVSRHYWYVTAPDERERRCANP